MSTFKAAALWLAGTLCAVAAMITLFAAVVFVAAVAVGIVVL